MSNIVKTLAASFSLELFSPLHSSSFIVSLFIPLWDYSSQQYAAFWGKDDGWVSFPGHQILPFWVGAEPDPPTQSISIWFNETQQSLVLLKKTAQCCFESLTPTLPCFSLPLLQAEIGPAALNLTDTPAGTGGSVGGSSSPTGNAGKAPAPPVGSASSPPAAAAPGGRRPASPASPAPKSPSKASPGRGKGTWRVEDLEGELERKIKMLEKERQAMRKETQGQHEKINQGIDTVSHRVTELEHSEYPGGR